MSALEKRVERLEGRTGTADDGPRSEPDRHAPTLPPHRLRRSAP